MRQTGPGSRGYMDLQLRHGEYRKVLQRVRQTGSVSVRRVDLQLRGGEYR